MSPTFATKIACGVIIEQDGHVVMVREYHEDEGERWNQPAGRIDPGEDLAACMLREAREECGLEIELTALLGVYLWPKSPEETWLRVCFIGRPTSGQSRSGLPRLQPQEREPVLEARWFTREELETTRPQFRNPITLRCLEDYDAGRRFPLEVLVDVLGQGRGA